MTRCHRVSGATCRRNAPRRDQGQRDQRMQGRGHEGICIDVHIAGLPRRACDQADRGPAQLRFGGDGDAKRLRGALEIVLEQLLFSGRPDERLLEAEDPLAVVIGFGEAALLEPNLGIVLGGHAVHGDPHIRYI